MVKVRHIGKNAERILHAPNQASGYYSMHYDEKSGKICYNPVREAK
jgi:Zn-finger protein